VYYLWVVKVMTIDAPPDGLGSSPMPIPSALYIVLITVPVVILGVAFNAALTWANWAASQLPFG
jgi:NADH:ubiquinone oxidoreductase subunit 2 (subunit N)